MAKSAADTEPRPPTVDDGATVPDVTVPDATGPDADAGLDTGPDGPGVGEAAGDAAADAAGAAVEGTAQLLRNLEDINFLRIAMIVVLVWLLILAVHRTLPWLASRVSIRARLYVLGAVPIARLLLMSIAVPAVALQIINPSVDNFFVIAGATSVAIGFAFKDYISSLIAGVVAIVERPYRPGDWVKIDGDYGEVRSVGLRAIQVVTPSDDVVTIPHVRMWENNISNSNDGARTLMTVTDFYVHPDHDADAVRRALHDVALSSVYLEYDKPIAVMLAQEPIGTHYRIKAYPFDLRDQFAFISDLTIRGKAALKQLGCQEIAAATTVS